MTTIKTTSVTEAELFEAQGGQGATSADLVRVECPDSYDVDAITAEDIVNDPAITVVR